MIGRVPVEPAAEQLRADERFAEGEFFAERVRDAERVPLRAGGFDKAAADGIGRQAHIGCGLAGEFHDFGAKGFRGNGADDGFADDDGDAGAEPAVPGAGEFAAFHAERVAPEAFDPGGNDGVLLAGFRFGDALIAAFEGHQMAGAGDLAFRKDAGQFAGFDLIAAEDERADGVARLRKINGHGAEEFEDGRQEFDVIERLPKNPADEARSGGADEERVGIGDVVANDNAAALGGDIMAAFNFEAEEGVKDRPTDETDRLTEHVAVQDVEGSGDGEQAADEENAFAAPVEPVVEQPKDTGCQDNTQHVGEVIRGQDPALLGGVCFVLQEGVEGDDEEAAEEAGEGEPDESGGFRGDGAEGARGKAHGDAGGGDEAEFDAFAGDPAGGHGAGADADGEGGDEQADLAFGAVKRVVDEDDERQLDQAADEPEERDAGDGEHHGAVVGEDAEAANDFREWVPVERLFGGRGGHFWDAKADERANDGEADKKGAHLPLVVFPVFEEQCAEAAADDDGDEGGEFQERVGAGKVAFGKDFGEDAVFGGAEEIGLRGEEEEHGEQHGHAGGLESEEGEDHRQNFEGLGDDEDFGFGESVGELAGPTGHQQERQDEDGAGEGEILGAGLGVAGGVGDGGDGDDHFENVVVEGAEELGPEERLEAAIAKERAIAGVCHAIYRGIWRANRRVARKWLHFHLSGGSGANRDRITSYKNRTRYDQEMSNAIRPSERAFLQAVAALAYANPFSPEREAMERAALGAEFVAGDPIWSVSVADPDRVRPNIWRIQEKLEPVLAAVRERLIGADGDFALYEECVHSLLYQRYYEQFAHATANWSFYRKFAADWAHFFEVPGKRYETALTVEHFFACCWQLARAFHRIFDHIIGSSRPAARLRASIWESIFTCDLRRYRRVLWKKMGDFPTLITGPSGTGKELVARAIAGARYLPFAPARMGFEQPKGESFFAVNLAALSPSLIESELFGHKRGAFTGAIADRVGWLEACPRQGAVFLDELGEMEMPIQVKLLRVMETREYSAVGDTATKRFEGKLIAATNRDLAAEIGAGRFREDLYYRLCADLIRTPSLAEQIDDVPASLDDLLLYMTRRTVGDEAEAAYPVVLDWVRANLPKSYRWPGNYRELEQCVRNVLIRQTYRPLGGAGDDFHARYERGELTAAEVLNHYATLVYRQTGSYVETARKLGLDRRTVKLHIENA